MEGAIEGTHGACEGLREAQLVTPPGPGRAPRAPRPVFQEFIREGCLHKLTKKGLQPRLFFLVGPAGGRGGGGVRTSHLPASGLWAPGCGAKAGRALVPVATGTSTPAHGRPAPRASPSARHIPAAARFPALRPLPLSPSLRRFRPHPRNGGQLPGPSTGSCGHF